MKKLLLTLSILSFAMLTSCRQGGPVKPATPPATPPPVENPAPPPAPSPRTTAPVVPKTTSEVKNTNRKNGTSVSISSNGLDIKNKNGNSENNVTISSKKRSSIEIKTN